MLHKTEGHSATSQDYCCLATTLCKSLLQGFDNFKIEIHQCSGVSLTVLPILLPVREQTEANRRDTEGVLLFNYITSVTGHKANC